MLEATSPRLVGARVRRVEDARLVSGLGRYLDDLAPAGTLHLRLVRSQFPSALVTSISIGDFEPAPEGTLLFTGDDTGHLAVRADVRHSSWRGSEQPVLARGRVRYVGEPVAAVLHPDPYVAEDAADLVSVDCEPLPAVVDLAGALDPGSPRVHEDWPDNLFVRRRRVFGDLDEARGQADRVIRRVLRTNRQAGVPLEGRGCLAVPEPTGASLTLWSSTQMPHLVRTYVARQLGLPEHALRVVAPDVGGGFGVKGHVFGEEVLVAWLALRTGRPVKWVEDRSEHLIASIHARDHLHLVEAFVSASGRVLGLRAQLVVDAGAYSVFPWTAGSDSGMAAKVLLGPYDIQRYEVEDVAVATNKCPLGTYRGVGRPSAVFTMERLMDEIARELGLDPAEVRRRNLIREFPYRTAMGLEYDPGSYAESMEKALEHVGYEALRRAPRERGGGRVRIGVGVAVYNEQTAHGTPDFEVRGTPIETGYESLALRMDPDGAVVVHTGLQSHGQSYETILAQVVAEELGVEFGTVRVVHGDTASSPYCVGTWGSRGAVLGGGAAARAARQVRAKLLAIAAHHLEVSEADLEIQDGVAHPRGYPGKGLAVAELAYIANRHTALLPPGIEPGLEATVFLDGPERGTFSNACHAAVVEVDTRTGKVRPVRYVVVEDCGVMINPTVVDGQVQGGVAQGIGSALLEEVKYSPEGQPLTSTFMDYLLPTSTDVPAVEVHHLQTPSPLTELGAKGMGEAGSIGPMAAVAGAVSDALGRPVLETPLRPERVWRLRHEPVDLDALWARWARLENLSGFWES
jgi:aerobic carbon-monoxide dehydrogenase large subunit